ncbi:MAG: hypothetical protein NTX57_17350 [Armatimonadetes bacterium]|nr:hypothetical protein [Armatimonadota bacterium]
MEIGRLDARCSGFFRRSKSEAAHGTYRTRDCILEIYDQMAAGHFVSPLDPPPAHGSRSSLAAKGGGSDDASATPNPLPNEERVQGEEGRRLSGGEMANQEKASAETPPAPDLGASDDDSPLTLALPVGRVQYRVVLEATGEIKNFVSPPAQVEE